MSPTELLAGGYRMGRQLVHALTADLTDDEFRYQPVPGANCAAWIVGHLAVTARRTAHRLGAADLPELTEEFIALYSQTKKPAGAQTELSAKADLLKLLDVCVDKLMDAVRAIPFESLNAPPAGVGQFATNFAEAVLFGAMHMTFHCGQLSTIRRSLGKPPML